MTCKVGSGVVVCQSDGPYRRAIQQCPTCERRTRHLLRWDGPWLGHAVHCVACGDTWVDGERCPRPFRRGWQAEATARYRDIWATGCMPANLWAARVQADIDEVCQPMERVTEALGLPYMDARPDEDVIKNIQDAARGVL